MIPLNVETFILLALLLVSLIDLKFKAIPSVLMSSILFMVALTRIHLIENAVILLIFGLLIQDIYQDRILGIADFKAFAIIGFMLINVAQVVMFIMIFLIFQIMWAFITRKLLKNSDKEIPFLIVFFLSYLTFYISRMVV